MARSKTDKPVQATLDDLARAVCSSDSAPNFRPQPKLASAARLTLFTLAVAALGRTVHVDLGNGHRLVCTVAPIAEGG